LVLSSQAVTPDCLVRARNTGQVRTGGGRAVLADSEVGQRKKENSGLHTKRKPRWIDVGMVTSSKR